MTLAFAPLGEDFFPFGALMLLLAIYAAAVLALIAAGRNTDARALAGFIPDCMRLLRRLLADPRTSTGQRLLLGAVIAYLLLPIDLVPDFIPVAGQLDDAIIVGLALAWVLRSHGEEAVRREWPGPDSSLRVVLRVAGARAGRPRGRVG